ncbi:MAG: fumarate hydratase [Kiritimatiellaeota bacterium]|nr:fumarate hydratase [Kiritimatiellota bacterium]
MPSTWTKSLLELIRRTSADLPRDVEAALRQARRQEKPQSSARWALDTILANIRLARARNAPLCQDTGTLLFYCAVPFRFDTRRLTAAIHAAVRQATHEGSLRPNTIDPLTGCSCAHNLGAGAPVIHIEFAPRRTVAIRLIMKGGGSENVSTQFSLPDARLKAGRDLEGVRRCMLAAVAQAQGNGCAPGVLGVCIGGDHATGTECAKRQFLRPLNDHASEARLVALERQVLADAQKLGIGPMGFGGATTLLGVKIGALARLPACYFVSVAYMCWAFRRRGVVLDSAGRVVRQLYD